MAARWGKQGVQWEYLSELGIDPDSVPLERFPNSMFGIKPRWMCYENPFGSSNNEVWKSGINYMLPGALFCASITPDTDEPEPEGVQYYRIVFRQGVADRLAHLPDEMIYNVILTEEEGNELAEIKTSVDSYMSECLAAFATGTMDVERDWETYVSTMQAIGLETYINIVQTAYTRMMSN